MKLEVPGGSVSARLDPVPDPAATFVLAHGAGADMNHIFMSTVAEGLAERGIAVWRFNFLYAERGRRAPDRQPILEETYAAVAERIRSRTAGPLFFGGKSMGGRIASHIVAAGTKACGVVFLGYPLHPPGKPERLRTAHLADVTVPMLFVEGTRDPFCPLDTLERARTGFTAPTEVAVIDDGDHSFKVRKSSGRTTEAAWTEVVSVVARWLRTATSP